MFGSLILYRVYLPQTRALSEIQPEPNLPTLYNKILRFNVNKMEKHAIFMSQYCCINKFVWGETMIPQIYAMPEISQGGKLIIKKCRSYCLVLIIVLTGTLIWTSKFSDSGK